MSIGSDNHVITSANKKQFEVKGWLLILLQKFNQQVLIFFSNRKYSNRLF
jgi:hypothetical protein